MDKKVKLGIFDIDGTIFRSSLSVELIHLLIENGIFPEKAGKELEKDYTSWLNRTGEYEVYVNQLVSIFVKYIPGLPVKKILKYSQEMLEVQQNHHYRYTRGLVKDLLSKGYHLVAVSGSPEFIVNDFTKKLGFHAAFGTQIEIKDGKFTNKFKVGDTNKILTIHKYLEDNNITVDWKNSVATGDTLTDIPLLQAVGRPIAFNPNQQLLKVANRMEWPVIVERKDVIYNLRNPKTVTNY